MRRLSSVGRTIQYIQVNKDLGWCCLDKNCEPTTVGISTDGGCIYSAMSLIEEEGDGYDSDHNNERIKNVNVTMLALLVAFPQDRDTGQSGSGSFVCTQDTLKKGITVSHLRGEGKKINAMAIDENRCFKYQRLTSIIPAQQSQNKAGQIENFNPERRDQRIKKFAKEYKDKNPNVSPVKCKKAAESAEKQWRDYETSRQVEHLKNLLPSPNVCWLVFVPCIFIYSVLVGS